MCCGQQLWFCTEARRETEREKLLADCKHRIWISLTDDNLFGRDMIIYPTDVLSGWIINPPPPPKRRCTHDVVTSTVSNSKHFSTFPNYASIYIYTRTTALSREVEHFRLQKLLVSSKLKLHSVRCIFLTFHLRCISNHFKSTLSCTFLF